MKAKNLGIVETRYFTFAHPPHPFKLERGGTLAPVTLAYETYGQLNPDKSNAILIEHTFTGDAHAAGYHPGDKNPGWWDAMIGPGKAIDTDQYFVICSNAIGGCKGSTGPGSVNPASGKPYALDFPVVTISDMVNAQKQLIDHLGIRELLSVIGGSMGGMKVLQWVASYPGYVASAIPIATTTKHSAQQIAFDEVGRQAIMADPLWKGGNYYDGPGPDKGLAVARMLGHITYMSQHSMEEKFARRMKEKDFNFKFTADFEVEEYLRYRGSSFVKRFDANSYLYITKAMDYFDLSGEKLIPQEKNADVKFLVIACKSDWLYPASQSHEMVRQLKTHHVDATYCEVDSEYGHDSFLVEFETQTHLVRHFLNKVYSERAKA